MDRPVLASVSTSITQFVGDRGLYAVFVLLLIDAVFPAGSELVMVYAGALAAGTFAGQDVAILGTTLHSGAAAFAAVVVVGAVGYLCGAVLGWWIGVTAGRPFVERHGRVFHLRPRSLERADAWFARYGNRAVFWGRLVPVVRSFISIPAGFERMPLRPYSILTLLGSLIWCLVFAAIGWIVGSSYESFNRWNEYLSIAIVVAVIGGAVVLLLRRRTRQAAHKKGL
jgi:membrane protein DedA with SNARE-associated domain